jgi:Uncharacterized conserved protein
MKYTIHPEVFVLNLSLQFGILIGKGLKNSESTEADVALLREAEVEARQIIQEDTLRSVPNIKAYRKTMEKAGINSNKYAVSTEAMLKRVLKGNALPTINALVDLCNVVSLQNQISLGGHDLRDIHADLSVCFSKGPNNFYPLEQRRMNRLKRESWYLPVVKLFRRESGFGGTYQRFVVNKDNSSIEFDV